MNNYYKAMVLHTIFINTILPFSETQLIPLVQYFTVVWYYIKKYSIPLEPIKNVDLKYHFRGGHNKLVIYKEKSCGLEVCSTRWS